MPEILYSKWVDSEGLLDKMCKELRNEVVIALDIEGHTDHSYLGMTLLRINYCPHLGILSVPLRCSNGRARVLVCVCWSE
jgi:hypothetical protein